MNSGFARKIIVLVVMLAVLGGALAATLMRMPRGTVRVVFYFPAYDGGRLCTEVRYLPARPAQGLERMFVEELLLGPMTNRYRRLFLPGTGLSFCFAEGGALYVGLDAGAMRSGSADIAGGVALLRENVLRAFPRLEAVHVFIDGREAYREE